jgi:hypothetical protein
MLFEACSTNASQNEKCIQNGGWKMKISLEEISSDGTIFLKLLKMSENEDSINFG